MPRGRVADPSFERPVTCANCQRMRFLRYSEASPYGVTGVHFCRLRYTETGAFDRQPWNFTCEDFVGRESDAVPVVAAPPGYVLEAV